MKQKKFLTISQAAKYIGVSRPTFYQLMEDKLISASKLTKAKLPRFTREDLNKLMNLKFPVSLETIDKKIDLIINLIKKDI